MNSAQFERVLEELLTRVENILGTKAGEYASDKDRLHNFKVTATIQGTTPAKALAGMMAKHTVSIYDMVRSDKEFPLEVWDEKITDHINYLILLRAIKTEEDLVDRALGTNGTT